MQIRPLKFGLSSEQCELLLAFENATSLQNLADLMLRDVSVISRQLQTMAGVAPVIEKVNGRWHISALGRQLNQWFRTAAESQAKILDHGNQNRLLDARLPSLSEQTALLVIGGQQGFLDRSWGSSNNAMAEERIQALLNLWRQRGWPLIHVHHHSSNPHSLLRKELVGAEPIPTLKPLSNEIVITKSSNSAFGNPELHETLRQQQVTSLVLAGYSGNHCVDATAKGAGDLGFSVFVTTDAVVTFERVSYEGKILTADQVHDVILANLLNESAFLITTEQILLHAKGYGVQA